MNLDRLTGPPTLTLAAVPFMPPHMVDGSAWDVLLALYQKDKGGLQVDELSALTSVSERALNQWLMNLEDRQLITGRVYGDELIVVLTERGRALLDRYLSAAAELQTLVRC